MRVNTPPTIAGYRNHLRDFVDAMVLKLHANSHKSTPDRHDILGIIDLLLEEVQEFRDQLAEERDDPNSLMELVDAANFAFLAFIALRNEGVMTARERYIKEHYRVDTDAGKVYCAKGRAGSRYRVGDEIRGTPRRGGYVTIRLQSRDIEFGESVQRSHLVWWAATGRWPTGVIDHINRDGSDDRFVNLRDVTCSENNLNRDKKSGLPPFVAQYKPRGGEHRKSYGKYKYQRRYKGSLYVYAYYSTPEEAAVAGLERFRKDVGYSTTREEGFQC